MVRQQPDLALQFSSPLCLQPQLVGPWRPGLCDNHGAFLDEEESVYDHQKLRNRLASKDLGS